MKREIQKLGKKNGYNWDRVRELQKKQELQKNQIKWTEKLLNKIILQRNGICIIWWKAGPNNALKAARGHRILGIFKDVNLPSEAKLMSSIKEFSKLAKVDVSSNHGISVLSGGALNNTLIYDNLTTNKYGTVPLL